MLHALRSPAAPDGPPRNLKSPTSAARAPRDRDNTPAEIDTRNLDTRLGRIVRARRMDLGLSQGELAKACDISFQQIQKYERGANRISVSRLAQMCGPLRATPGWFCQAAGLEEGRTDTALADALAATPQGRDLIAIAADLPADRLRALLATARALRPQEDL